MSEVMIAKEEKEVMIDKSIYNAPYVVKDGSLFEMVTVKNQTIPAKLADFVPTLIAEVTHDDGIEQHKFFRIGGVHKSGAVLPEVLVSADEMQSMKWTLTKWGTLGAAEPRHNVLGKICHAILNTKAEVRYETVYLQTGWKKISNKYVFLMPNTDRIYTVELQGKLKNYSFKGNCLQSDLIYLSAMLESSFAPQRVMLPMIAVTFLSSLNHFLKGAGYEPKFVTAIVGTTGSRKSTLAALFLSFFGKFGASDLPMSFHDTANSILANIYYLKDVLTCVDDFHPSGVFREQEMKNIAQDISRYYGDRIGRARLNSKTELQESRPPTGNCIITAEYAPELSVSGSARYFNIELNQNDINLTELSDYQQLAAKGVLSGIMQFYVEWLSETFLSNEIEFENMLAEMFLKFRKSYMDKLCERKIEFHNRTPDMLAHLKIGFEFVLMFLNAHGMITNSESEKYTKVFDEIILKNVSDNSENLLSESPTAKFCEKLRSLLDSGRCYLETKGCENIPRQKNCIGLQDNDYFYLFADAAHSEVRKLCAEQGEHFTLSKNELLKQLRKENILVSHTNRNTISIRDNSKKVVNVVFLDRSVLKF